MTVPGLALYAGLVRAKNVVSMLMQVFAIVCMVVLIWVLYGYSLAFTCGSLQQLCRRIVEGVPDGSDAGVDRRHVLERRGHPRIRLHRFQMTFACITPALIVGGFAERMKFSAMMLFVASG